MTAGDGAAVRTRDELEAEIRAFTPAQWARLRRVAQRYAGVARMPAEDLLQEAYRRALEGGRNCPRHVDVVRFLAEAMRGVAGDEAEKLENTAIHVAVVGPGEARTDAVDPAAIRRNAEDEAVLLGTVKEIRAAILGLFPDDSVARDLLDGVMEDFSAEELRELTGLDEKAYASKRRLIRRTIDKHYPEGWKP